MRFGEGARTVRTQCCGEAASRRFGEKGADGREGFNESVSGKGEARRGGERLRRRGR